MTKTAALPPIGRLDYPLAPEIAGRIGAAAPAVETNGSGIEALRFQNFTPSPTRKLLR